MSILYIVDSENHRNFYLNCVIQILLLFINIYKLFKLNITRNKMDCLRRQDIGCACFAYCLFLMCTWVVCAKAYCCILM